MPSQPSGIVTFLFTDVQGSTVLWDRYPAEMKAALADHDRRIRDAVEAHRGYVFTTAGDSFSVAFADVRDAFDTAVELQLSLRDLTSEVELRVRSGIHTGEATVRDGDYFGSSVNRCARITSAGHGGQILISGSSRELLGDDLPEHVEIVDLGVHRLRDLAEPERILQVCHPDLDREFPRLRTIEGPGDTLPTQLTSFIGRDHEIGEIVELLRDRRLVTLTGPGGAGKTRLSLEVAERVILDHGDGIRLVELAPLVDADVFVDEVAQRFGATRVADVPLGETIAATIKDRRMLLILDNCEHLVEPVARLTSDLLLACSNLHVIATSRERLAITGEVVYRVPSLSVPPAGIDVDKSLEFDAIRLFVERGQLANPGFEVNSSNVADIASICRRLDGIPLALELAAARVRSMSPHQIDSRLDERFRLLTGTDRSSDERHQTLLSTIEWSHGLLEENERLAFRRLGMFVSDFSLEAAEAVCADASILEFDVIELVTALVDKSMVTSLSSTEGDSRYLLLESIRAYASEHLDQAGEQPATAERHARYYTRLAADLQHRHRTGELAGALAVLDEEEDNFRSSLRHAIDHRDALLAARLVDGLGYLWYAGGVHREGLEWCRAVFEIPADLPDDVRAGALHSYASMLGVNGLPEQAIEVMTEEVVLRRRLADPARLASALNNLGIFLQDAGDHDAAEVALREAVDAQRDCGQSAALMVSGIAFGHLQAGRPGAEDLYAEALAEATRFDDRYAIAQTMMGLGEALVRSGRPGEARPHLVESRERFEELNVLAGVSEADRLLALVHRADGDRVESARCLLASITSPVQGWNDEAPAWAVQIAASVIDDLTIAATLAGAATADYERRTVRQAPFILDDLDVTRRRLAEQLGDEDFSRCMRAGARRTRTEFVDIAIRGLGAFIDAHDHHPDELGP